MDELEDIMVSLRNQTNPGEVSKKKRNQTKRPHGERSTYMISTTGKYTQTESKLVNA